MLNELITPLVWGLITVLAVCMWLVNASNSTKDNRKVFWYILVSSYFRSDGYSFILASLIFGCLLVVLVAVTHLVYTSISFETCCKLLLLHLDAYICAWLFCTILPVDTNVYMTGWNKESSSNLYISIFYCLLAAHA